MAGLGLEQLELVFYVLLGVIVLTLAVLILYVVISNRRERVKLAQAYEVDSLAPRPALRVSGQVLALVRDAPGLPLQVEIAGKRYRSLSAIEDRQVRRQVIDSALELIQFTGVLGGEAQAPAPLENTYRWREDVREASQEELAQAEKVSGDKRQTRTRPVPTADVEEQFLSLLAEMSKASPGDKPNLVKALQARWAAKAGEQTPVRSFVEDIEEIIQRRIQLMPALARRQLHVRQGPDSGVRFVFEGQEYDTIEDIPNLTARQVVRDAIQEWDETT